MEDDFTITHLCPFLKMIFRQLSKLLSVDRKQIGKKHSVVFL